MEEFRVAWTLGLLWQWENTMDMKHNNPTIEEFNNLFISVLYITYKYISDMQMILLLTVANNATEANSLFRNKCTKVCMALCKHIL